MRLELLAGSRREVGAGEDPSRSILRAVTGPTPWKRATGSEATNRAPSPA